MRRVEHRRRTPVSPDVDSRGARPVRRHGGDGGRQLQPLQRPLRLRSAAGRWNVLVEGAVGRGQGEDPGVAFPRGFSAHQSRRQIVPPFVCPADGNKFIEN